MSAKKEVAYGQHLMLDGYHANAQKLCDVNLLYEVLNTLPSKLGMHKVGFPHIIQFKEQPIIGISGFIFIVESHISIHTYFQQRFISVDAYSCKSFNAMKIVELLKSTYDFKDEEVQVVKRGTYFRL